MKEELMPMQAHGTTEVGTGAQVGAVKCRSRKYKDCRRSAALEIMMDSHRIAVKANAIITSETTVDSLQNAGWLRIGMSVGVHM